MKVEKAKITDAREVYEFIRKYASKGVVLPRPISEIYEKIREFFVVRKNRKIIGTVALHIVWEDIAEVRSLIVDEKMRGKGIGKNLLNAALGEARKLKIPKVFALTREPEFFARFGFKKVSKNKLPQKVWADCINCPLFPDHCDEVPVIIYLEKNST